FGLGRVARFSDNFTRSRSSKSFTICLWECGSSRSMVGGLAENHIQGSILGNLFHESFSQQWALIRDSDRFWFEAPDAGFKILRLMIFIIQLGYQLFKEILQQILTI